MRNGIVAIDGVIIYLYYDLKICGPFSIFHQILKRKNFFYRFNVGYSLIRRNNSRKYFVVCRVSMECYYRYFVSLKI